MAPRDWLVQAAKIIRQKKAIRILGGPVLDFVPRGTHLPAGFRPEGWKESYGRRERFLAPKEPLTECNLMIQTSVFRKAGGFRPDLGPGNRRFGFHEGTELQARIRQRSGKRGAGFYSPKLPMRHLVRPGRVNFTSRLWRSFISGYDFARAFPQDNKSLEELLGRMLVKAACFFAFLPLNSQAAHRSLFRLGEYAGQAFRHKGWLCTHATPREF